MSNYSGTIQDGRAIYIPAWPAKVQFENLSTACKLLGQDNIVNISDINVPAAMLAIMNADDPQKATEMMFHFVKQARIDGEKLQSDSDVGDLGMATIVELFSHVIHSQFNDFFVSGLAKANYQPQ
jgi:hypothetical protein|tara:strand:+ start:5765 stop:6139 length:375 start_codon:yes stop_codon:yes gene_type:complete